MAEVSIEQLEVPYGYAPPEHLKRHQVFELYERFMSFFMGEDPFVGITEDINLPLQIMILTFDKDCRSVKEDMFALYEAMYESGFITRDEVYDYIDVLMEENEEEIGESTMLEFYLLSRTMKGSSVQNLVFSVFYAPSIQEIGVIDCGE